MVTAVEEDTGVLEAGGLGSSPWAYKIYIVHADTHLGDFETTVR